MQKSYSAQGSYPEQNYYTPVSSPTTRSYSSPGQPLRSPSPSYGAARSSYMTERSVRPLSYPSAPGEQHYDRASQLPWLANQPLRDSYDSINPPEKLHRASSSTLDSTSAAPVRTASPTRPREVRYRKRRRNWVIAGAAAVVLATAGGVAGGVLGSRQSPDNDTTPYGTLLAPAPSTPVAAVARYDAIVVFGASYCDNAHPRASQYSGSITSSPYFDGRWTNGLIWAEYLAGFVGPTATQPAALLDYAYAGAHVNNNLTGPKNVPDTASQINTYLAQVKGGNATVATLANQRELYLIWVGLNPILDVWTTASGGGFSPSAQSNALSTLSNVTASFKTQLQTLLTARPGARLVILTIPGLQLLPTIIGRYPGDIALNFARQLTSTYNDGIYAFAGTLGSNTTVYNASSLWTNYTTSPKGFGLSNVKQGYLNSGTSANASTFLFWDGVHPTTTIHADLARRLTGYLNGTLPAT